MASNAELAQVLEDAADLYQAEKVNWCVGSWYLVPEEDEVPKITMCAATAIGVAAGLGYLVPENVDGFDPQEGSPYSVADALANIESLAKEDMEWLLDDERDQYLRCTPESLVLYHEARAVVEVRIDQELPSFNDAEHEPRTKADIIELFKATAKDLRNG